MQLPVRRHSHVNPAKTLEQIRQEVETYALVFPQVAFSVQNTTAAREASGSGSGREYVVRVPKVGNPASFGE